MKRLFPFNASLSIIVSEPSRKFIVTDDKIVSTRDDISPDYYLGVNWYFASWHRLRDGGVRNGRYFPSQRIQDRFSLVAGFLASSPTTSFYVGPTFEVLQGFSITAGWQPRQVSKLKGYRVGDTIKGSIPIEQEWDFGRVGGGVSFDLAIGQALLRLIQNK